MNINYDIDIKKKYISNNSNSIFLSDKQILIYFYEFINKNIVEIYEKFKNYKNILDIVNYSCNLIFNIYWIIFNSSKNIFITLFLLDKSILLFTEFLILSSDPNIVKDLYYKPNIIDAINFSYKKIVNNIKISSLNSNNKKIMNISLLIKDIIKNYIVNNENYNQITNIIVKKYFVIKNNNFNYIYNKILLLLKKNRDLVQFVNNLK